MTSDVEAYRLRRLAERRKRALVYAQTHREYGSWAEVARQFRMTPQGIYYVVSAACPDFGSLDLPPPWQSKEADPPPPESSRPAWSYPDDITRAIAAQARAEIAQAETKARENGVLPSPAWSYPDAITRAIAAEARAEIQAALRAEEETFSLG